jgi:sialate O-acetylesterase
MKVLARWMAVSLACVPVVASAEVKLASVFTDHMVIQRDKPVAVWGTASPGKTVTVTAGDLSATAKADGDGKFVVKLPATGADAKGRELVATEEGGNTVTLGDVLVGDVWVASGQSNMEWTLANSKGGKQDAAAANDPGIRLLLVKRAYGDEPKKEIVGEWKVCSPESAGQFSGIAYYFAQDLRQSEKVPVGVIGTYWGGTPAEAWTPAEALAANDGLKPLLDKAKADAARVKGVTEKWEQQTKAFEAATRSTDPAVKRAASRPASPPVATWRQSTQLWNGMVAPIVPYTIKGVIWYQGESNASRAAEYRVLFPTLINAWRQAFDQGDVPFLFVQLANFKNPATQPAASEWAELREAQSLTLKLPNTGMAIAIDNADMTNPSDIHPKDKKTIGMRLARVAQKQVYGHADAQASGPTLAKMAVEGDRVRLTFDHATGLVAKDGKVGGFAVAGEDRKFAWAEDPKIEGNTVVFKTPVKDPVAVRYSWSENPDVVLYNAAGLPAEPFRTDDWELGKK